MMDGTEDVYAIPVGMEKEFEAWCNDWVDDDRRPGLPFYLAHTFLKDIDFTFDNPQLDGVTLKGDV